MKDKTGKLIKVNANDLFSGRVKEHTLFNCHCGQKHDAEIRGTVTGRISSNDSNTKSNTPKHGTPS